MALTREPSGKRASQIGEDSSTRRPIWLTMRWQMLRSCWLSRKRIPVFWILPGDFDVDRAGAVDHDVGDVVARQQRLERTVAEHVVADVVEQFFLLGDRHHDVLDRDDLVDDVADFLARGLGVEPGELREIDRLDQRAEDGALDLVIASDRRVSTAVGALAVGARGAVGGGDDRRAQAVGRKRRAAGFDGSRRRRPLAPRPDGSGAGAGAADAGGPTTRASEVPLRLPNTTSYSRRISACCASSASRATATADRREASWLRRGRSAPARSGGTSRRSYDWPTLPRSSGRCWRPIRTAAARTE